MIAVIDIGTNTFHLLIASIVDDEKYHIEYRESIFVRIAQDGIDPISQKALKRAMKTLKHFVSVMESYEITNIRVVGTEALRSASNGGELISQAKEILGLSIEIISGEEEARLIFEGTVHAIPAYEEPYLIMDIGGGSVEFIIAKADEILWWGSYKLGVQYLFLKYPLDPLDADDISALRLELTETLNRLKSQINYFKPTRLVGSSGSFETLASLAGRNGSADNYIIVPSADFSEIFEKLISSTYEERLANELIPKDRAELIVIGFILVDYVLSLLTVEEIVVSAYALREGLLYSDVKYGKIKKPDQNVT